jgi:riboflavin biosynthesis pyrimidine reductase
MRDQNDKYDLTFLLSDITNSTTVTIIPCKGSYSGSDSHHLDIHDVLRRLYDQCNITSVMVEGGASILSSFVSADVVDCYCVTIAPVLLGGNGLDAFTFTRVSTKSMIDDGIDVATELGRHVQFIPLGNDCIFLGSG